MKNPKVSVIMSFYNENIEYIKYAVESILNQTYKDFEFVIIGDNPNNYEAIKYIDYIQTKDSRIIFKKNDENKGLVYSLNTAISISRGKYIVRMDADDISSNNRIEEQVKYMESNEDIDLLGTEIELIDENNKLINNKVSMKSKSSKSISKILRYGNMIAHPSMIYKKDVILELGLYREVKYAEDYDLLLRLISNNKNIYVLNKSLLKYRVRKDGISRSKSKEQAKSVQYITKLYKDNSLNLFNENTNNKYIEESINIKDKIMFIKNKIFFIVLLKILK